MSGTAYERLRKILAFAAVVEIATGLALIVDPALVIRLLVGAKAPIENAPLGQFPGIAILALGVACWPGPTERREVLAGGLSGNAAI